jgi:hypothetical protein
MRFKTSHERIFVCSLELSTDKRLIEDIPDDEKKRIAAEKRRNYKKENQAKLSEQNRQYYKNNIEKIKKYREENRERIRIRAAEFRKNHPDIAKARDERSRNKDREKGRERSRSWKSRNKEKIRDYSKKYLKQYYKENQTEILQRSKDYYKNHKKERRAYFKKRQKEDFLFYVSCRVRSLVSDSLRKKKYTKRSKTYQMVGCSFEELMIHLGPKPEGKTHIDHICPCSQAQNEEELVKLQHYSNLRWISAEENLKKSDNRTPEGEILCNRLLNREWL